MIDLYSSSSNLGDNLGLTPLCAATPCRVHMYDDAGCREVAPIFNGLAEVVFDNGSPEKGPPKSNDPMEINAPNSLRHLLRFGQSGKNAIPVMKLTEKEIAWTHILDHLLSNPCILKASPGKHSERTPPMEVIQKIVDENPDVTFLTFGLSKNHPKYNFVDAVPKGDNVKAFYDLSIRQLAAIYHVVGRYIGADTGDYHLMLAVGGKCEVLVPRESPTYPYSYFHYNDVCWRGEIPRARYAQWWDYEPDIL